MAKRSGTGQGGKSFQDRELASKVRTQALNDIYLVLLEDKKVSKFSDYKKQLLLKMSASLLPRLNEHTGADGQELPTPIFNVQGNNSSQENNSPQKED